MSAPLPRGPLSEPVPDRPLRLALIGAGKAGLAHLRAAQAHPDRLRFVAIAEPNLAAAQALATDSVRLTADYRRLLERPDDIDAVIIALPHHLHEPVTRACLEAGQPVLLEKPIARCLAEAETLHALADQHRLLLAIGHNKRFLPETLWLRHWIAADPTHFGQLRSFDLGLCQNLQCNPHYQDPASWVLDGARAGGGVLISLAVHQLDLLRYLTGQDYASVMALGRHDPPFHNGAESAVTALLSLDNGASGVLHANLNAPRVQCCERWCLLGSHGTALREVVSGKYEGPVRYASAPAPTERQWRAMYEGFAPVPTAAVLAAGWTDQGFANQLLHFAACLQHGHRPLNAIASVLNTMACLDALATSLRTRQPAAVAR